MLLIQREPSRKRHSLIYVLTSLIRMRNSRMGYLSNSPCFQSFVSYHLFEYIRMYPVAPLDISITITPNPLKNLMPILQPITTRHHHLILNSNPPLRHIHLRKTNIRSSRILILPTLHMRFMSPL